MDINYFIYDENYVLLIKYIDTNTIGGNKNYTIKKQIMFFGFDGHF